MKQAQHNGAWTLSLKPLTSQVFKWNGARSGVSIYMKASAGAARTVGERVMTQTSPAIGPAVVIHYTAPAEGSTTICTDELGPVIPRTFAPAPGWSIDGHRIKAPLEYSRGDDKVWISGALRVRDGKEITRCAASRNSKNYIELLKDIEANTPTGDIFIITDNLSSHNRLETRTWLAEHPRLQHVFIPKGACWLNLQEGWWRLFRRDAFAGQSFATASEIERAMQVATAQLNHRAKPWIWGRPPKTRRHLHRLFCYRL